MLVILVFIIISLTILAEGSYPLNVTLISIKEDFLLKSDGSIEVTSETFGIYAPIKDDAVIVFGSNIAQIKDYADLQIFDLSQSPPKEYTLVADVLAGIYDINCAGKYSIKDNQILVCSPLNEDNQLHFRKKYTLLPDIKCKEIERRQQSFSYQYLIQDEPYSLEYTTRAEKGLKYLSPKNCPKEPVSWEIFEIDNGMKCKIEKLKFSEDIDKSLFLTLDATITGEMEDIIEQQEKKSEDIKNIIIEVITLIIIFLAIIDYNWKGYIKSYFDKSRKNKIICIIILIIYLTLFVIFRLW